MEKDSVCYLVKGSSNKVHGIQSIAGNNNTISGNINIILNINFDSQDITIGEYKEKIKMLIDYIIKMKKEE